MTNGLALFNHWIQKKTSGLVNYDLNDIVIEIIIWNLITRRAGKTMWDFRFTLNGLISYHPFMEYGETSHYSNLRSVQPVVYGNLHYTKR